MTVRARLVWSAAVGYLLFVAVVTSILIVVGYLLSRLPGLPGWIDRAYARGLQRLLDTLYRPFDALPDRQDG